MMDLRGQSVKGLEEIFSLSDHCGGNKGGISISDHHHHRSIHSELPTIGTRTQGSDVRTNHEAVTSSTAIREVVEFLGDDTLEVGVVALKGVDLLCNRFQRCHLVFSFEEDTNLASQGREVNPWRITSRFLSP